ncbi:MAG: hypothetical protein ABIQ70_02500 [Dokdonella sp.]
MFEWLRRKTENTQRHSPTLDEPVVSLVASKVQQLDGLLQSIVSDVACELTLEYPHFSSTSVQRAEIGYFALALLNYSVNQFSGWSESSKRRICPQIIARVIGHLKAPNETLFTAQAKFLMRMETFYQFCVPRLFDDDLTDEGAATALSVPWSYMTTGEHLSVLEHLLYATRSQRRMRYILGMVREITTEIGDKLPLP